MKKIILTLLMLVVATATMSAQDEMEQTLPPIIMPDSYPDIYRYYVNDDHYDEFFIEDYYVTLEPADDTETTIYYRITRGDEEPTEWMVYDGMGLSFTYRGGYVFEAYAQSLGKLPSEVVSTWFYVSNDYMGSHFRVDGVYYTSCDNETLEVTGSFVDNYSEVLSYSGDIVIPDTVEIEGNTFTVVGIGQQTFASPDVKSVVLPNTLTYIQFQAFYGSGISELCIPASVVDIAEEAFYDCNSLESISVNPDNTVFDSRNDCNAIIVTSSNELLIGCQNTVIPPSVTSIGIGAFHGCTGLTTVMIPNTITIISHAAFYGCGSLTKIELPSSLVTIGGSVFANCSSLTSVSIPNSVTKIGSGTFAGCISLENIELPHSITSIENGLFNRCSALSGIEIPTSVTTIGSSAFYDCKSLVDLVIPDSITSVGYVAFSNCTGLKTVTIGKSVTSLSSSFKGCTAMTSMKVLATTPPNVSWVFSYIGNSEDYLYNQVTLFVPKESLETYSAHKTWGKFSRIVPFIGVGPGDTNGDGEINIADVTGLIDVLLSGGELPAYFDVDGDGEVNIKDVTDLIDALLGFN